MNVDQDSQLTGAVIGAAIAVHRELGPGAAEPAYEEALSVRLTSDGIPHRCQKPLPLVYKGVKLDCGFRIDVLVEERLPLELKAVEALLPIHEAQLLTYLRLGKYPLGLLMNFDVPVLKEGVERRALTRPRSAPGRSSVDLRDGFDALSADILHGAVEVHRELGPGLLRSAYEEALCHELTQRGVPYRRKCKVPLSFGGRTLRTSVEVPLVVSKQVPVFCLSVNRLTRLHAARLRSRLRQGNWPYGFLLNFNANTLKQGIRRIELR